MSLDPNRWTIKTQEAVQAAISSAKSQSHPEVTADHLLAALLGQPEGVVLPIINQLGIKPLTLRNQLDEALAKLPRAYGGESRMGRDFSRVMEAARLTPRSWCVSILRMSMACSG